MSDNNKTVQAYLRVRIEILVDETTDVSDLLSDIRHQSGTLNVAGFSFDAKIDAVS